MKSSSCCDMPVVSDNDLFSLGDPFLTFAKHRPMSDQDLLSSITKSYGTQISLPKCSYVIIFLYVVSSCLTCICDNLEYIAVIVDVNTVVHHVCNRRIHNFNQFSPGEMSFANKDIP